MCATAGHASLCSGRTSTCCQVRRGGTLVAQQVQQQEDEKVNALLHNPTGEYSTPAAPQISLLHQTVWGTVLAIHMCHAG